MSIFNLRAVQKDSGRGVAVAWLLCIIRLLVAYPDIRTAVRTTYVVYEATSDSVVQYDVRRSRKTTKIIVKSARITPFTTPAAVYCCKLM